MRYLVYARVSPKGSTWTATETSISTQTDMCRQYVIAHGGEVADVVTDEFQSAKDTNRPGLKTVLADLEHGEPDWDTIIVYKLDRLTRSLCDAAPLFELLRQKNKGFVSLHEQLDLSTPTGRAFLFILCTFAQLEREQTGQRTRDKMISIAKSGGWPAGKTPIGYVRQEAHNNTLAVDPRGAEVVRDIFERYARGESLDTIAEVYKGVVARNTIINRILRNRIYLGKIVYADEEYEGNHDAILPPELFEEVQRRLPKKRRAPRPNAQSRPFLLTGLLYCRCGHAMTPYSTYGKGGKYFYYRCVDRVTCRGKHFPAEKLEKSILDTVKAMEIPEDGIRVMVDTIRERRDAFRQQAAPELAQVGRALTEAEAEQKQIEKAFLTGVVNQQNKDHWNGRLARINNEIEQLKIRRDELKAATEADLGPFERAENVVQSLRDIAASLKRAGDSPNLRRAFLVARVRRIEQGEKDGETGFWIHLNYPDERGLTKWHDWRPQGDSNPCCRDENPVS